MEVIAIEGFDRVGKTTFAHILASKWNAVLVHEPTTEPPECYTLPEEQAFWFMQDRVRLARELRAHNVERVVADRSFVSTCVYQGMPYNAKLMRWALRDYFPKLVVYIEENPHIVLHRNPEVVNTISGITEYYIKYQQVLDQLSKHIPVVYWNKQEIDGELDMIANVILREYKTLPAGWWILQRLIDNPPRTCYNK